MSGICGVALRDPAQRLTPAQLAAMVRALDVSAHSQDVTVQRGTVGLGAQGVRGRMAGVAELAVQERSLLLAFYGSLYNLSELRPAAHQTPNLLTWLLHLYSREKMAFVQRLRGEFALALWDGLTDTLYLATDRFRVHPLLYYHDPDKLIFASRMKGIFACPFPVKRTINPEAIVDVVASSFIPTPKTIFKEVRKLPPGHILAYQNGETKLTPYWDISFLKSDGDDQQALVRKLRSHLRDAIDIRLEGDGAAERIGTFLSGGVDSSTVTGILTQLTGHPIKSFSIGFEEQRFNEIDYARIAAQAFGAEHHEYFVTSQDTCDALPVLLEAFDEPYANASAIPTYFCAKLAREHDVDVLYAGDGGDELFAGNERYAAQRLFDYYTRAPAWLREPLVKPIIFALADGLNWQVLVKGKKYIQRASIPYPERLWSYGFFTIVPMTELLQGGLLEAVGQDYDPYAPVGQYYFQAPAHSELDRQLYIDLKLAISDNDLFKVTRMTEAAGVTVRFPFLDHPLAEFAASIPARVKMPGLQLRSFFKKAYADLLPLATRTKQKHGFGLPIPTWLRTDKRLEAMMQDLVLGPRSVQRGYFCKKALEELVACHKTDQTSFYGTTLWNLMVLELWHRTFV